MYAFSYVYTYTQTWWLVMSFLSSPFCLMFSPPIWPPPKHKLINSGRLWQWSLIRPCLQGFIPISRFMNRALLRGVLTAVIHAEAEKRWAHCGLFLWNSLSCNPAAMLSDDWQEDGRSCGKSPVSFCKISLDTAAFQQTAGEPLSGDQLESLSGGCLWSQ